MSTTEVGMGGTNHWYMGGMDRTKTLAVFFDIVQTEAKVKQ